ncbi:MAG: hypothetical protein N2Z21_01260 [Candidatus Sumerlaeaceae bacterium]|nr:hypothetical protein [Candidatus Sumerlaeaceae bacterium]
MPELKPLPIATLLRRLIREHEKQQKIFDLPATKFWRGCEDLSLGVTAHGKTAGTPFGPAAGPHTQMAQNIVLSWLAGARIIELKTVQINDRLTIPRPCIDAANVCYNVEFSQELRLEESLEEYVKAWMLIRIVEELGILGTTKRAKSSAPTVSPHFYDCIFDLSCGYSLEGIASPRMHWFIRAMKNAEQEIERLRQQIPNEFKSLRDLDFDPNIVSTATLSTFHGCPPDEIEGIVEHLLREHGLHVVIKMNPTMLGRARVEELLNDVLGYSDIQVNPAAFESGLQFDEALGLVRRLRKLGRSLGLVVGVKFSNTLEVINHRSFLPKTEKVMYLSGPPLYPIALELANRFAEAYRASAEEAWDKELPISFSAGVDRHNFAACVAAGMVPVTVCTDMLKPGGYSRAHDYLQSLASDMRECGVLTVDEYIVRKAQGSGCSARDAMWANLRRAWEDALQDTRYTKAKNSLVPKRINSQLWLFDCITCDKCIPVCPNDANFVYRVQVQNPRPCTVYEICGNALIPVRNENFELKKERQIANFGPFCNECGNCDTFCPEYGGPYVEKPTFFATVEDWENSRRYDGFVITHGETEDSIVGRIKGVEYSLTIATGGLAKTGWHIFETPEGKFAIASETLEPRVMELRRPHGILDIGIYLTLLALLRGVLYGKEVNYVNAAYADLI